MKRSILHCDMDCFYAYAIDYVIWHRCDLPKPDIDGLFPRNYPDYNYWEGLLVGKVNEYIEL